MNVKDYALDINKSVEDVLDKCNMLGFGLNENDFLDDDIIVELDTYYQNETTEMEDDLVEEIVEGMVSKGSLKVDLTVKKEKLKKVSLSNQDINNQKKAMYKNREKLMNNKEDESVVLYKEGLTVSEFALLMEVLPVDIIKKLMSVGLMSNLNDIVTYENAEILALDYGKTLKKEESVDVSNFEEYEISDNEEDLVERPPVVTIMGHVDHGKTSLLDYIRNSSVVSGEAGGITQAIGAYQIIHSGKKITFIDTPGHAAFTEMRARGASVTDIVIIIVAADDGVMPQTKEAIDHAKAANVPIIVAVNKIDKPEANIERVMTAMVEAGITPDIWGGDTLFVNISAKTGEGIDTLLENIILISEMSNLKVNPKRYATGSVIESRLDKNIGSVVTLLIQSGTLRLGDPLVVGTEFGKVRTMKNDRGEEIVEALPSLPVTITGLSEVPSAGDKFMAFESEKEAKSVSSQRKSNEKMKTAGAKLNLEELFSRIQSGIKEINVVLKADVNGSEEAVKNSLEKIDVKGVKIKVIRSGVGAISESDVILANASNAIIIGFNVVATSKSRELANTYNLEIRLYNIIYKVVEEMEQAMLGLLDPEFEESRLGSAEVRKLFKFSKVGIIAGSYVVDGVIKQKCSARVIRDGIVIFDGKIDTIQREKDQTKEVKQGFECGITIEGYNDLKEKDIIEVYEMIEVKRK